MAKETIPYGFKEYLGDYLVVLSFLFFPSVISIFYATIYNDWADIFLVPLVQVGWLIFWVLVAWVCKDVEIIE